MANRLYNQFKGSLQKGVIMLYAKLNVVSGVAEIVTEEILLGQQNPTTVNPSNGFVHTFVSPVTPPGPGAFPVYTLPLQDPYVRLLDVNVVAVSPQGSSIPLSVVVQQDDVTNLAAPSITVAFACLNPGTGAVTPAVPADGTILLRVDLSNSTAF